MRYRIFKVPEYQNWLEKEVPKSQVQIASRLELIETEGYFGNHKDLGDHVWELKWYMFTQWRQLKRFSLSQRGQICCALLLIRRAGLSIRRKSQHLCPLCKR